MRKSLRISSDCSSCHAGPLPLSRPAALDLVNLALSTFVFWVAAKLYVLPKLQVYEARTILLPILLLHSLRHLGLMFLASGATYPGIPPQFTHPAAYGDLIAAVLAMIAIPAVATRARSAKLLVWLFNLVGSLDNLRASRPL
jgi:hypothetical protein